MAPIASSNMEKAESKMEVETLVNYNNNNFATSMASPCPLQAPLVVCVVGPTCHGKSLASHKICRHLCWKGEGAKVFSAPINADPDTLKDVQDWFDADNNVAIIDGMHLTRQSRQEINNFCLEKNFHYLIIEFKCNDQSLTENIADTVEFYKNLDANTDWYKVFKGKLNTYLPKYQSCLPSEGPLICVNNSEDAVHHSVVAKGVLGALQTSILGVLVAPVMRKQVFYFSRHGESEYNVLGRIGGNADLSPRGLKYCERLTRHFSKAGTAANPKPKLIWTSELQRTIHTVQYIPGVRTSLKDLNEINAGICEGLTYEEIQERFPTEFAWRDQDKLKYRYPHGESYLDLLKRVDGVVQALLTKTDVLVVSHQAVLRTIMAYFLGSAHEEIPYINVPLHSLLIVRSFGYDYKVEIVAMQVDCVDTYRDQPTNCSIKRTADDALTTVPAHFDKIHHIPQHIS